MTMRGMDGFETVARLRRLDAFRATPVVFVTGYADSVSSVHQGYAAGAIDYVTKPIDPDLLRLKAASFVLLYQRGEELKRRALEVAIAESARKSAEEYSEENARLYRPPSGRRPPARSCWRWCRTTCRTLSWRS